jgi:membrane associated rhomboid family serine protease
MEFWRDKFREAPVTAALSVVLAVCFASEFVMPPAWTGALVLSRDALDRGAWWTVATHLFLHANLLHLMVNVLTLWFVGPEVERLLGRVRFLVLYFVSGAAGGLLQIYFSSSPSEQLVGASGSVCGVLLSFTTAYPELPLRALLFFVLPVSMKAKTLGRGLIVVSLLAAVLRIVPQIGHLAHLGGALAGWLLTKWWAPAGEPRRAPARSTDELLARVMEDGIEGLSREERRQLGELASRREP